MLVKRFIRLMAIVYKQWLIAFVKIKQTWAAINTPRYLYWIEEFNITKNQVLIHCHRARSLIIISIEKTLTDLDILQGLSSTQAFWLGYYYGKFEQEHVAFKVNKNRGSNFALRCKKGRFKIISLDNNSSDIITYVDLKTNKIYKESILQLAQNGFVIDNIDPTQACYIGMLVGIMVAKKDNNLLPIHKKPILKIVK